MNKRIVRDPLILLSVCSAVWVFFTFVDVFPDVSGLEISTAKEETVGNMLVNHQIKDNPAFWLIKDSSIDSLMEPMYNMLINGLEKPSFGYNFYILKNESANAFTMPVVIFLFILD